MANVNKENGNNSMKLDENQKVTLTIGQLRRLVKEATEVDYTDPESIQKRIDELEDELYELDRHYIAHHHEYSDKYWHDWYREMGYMQKDFEIQQLKKELAKM